MSKLIPASTTLIAVCIAFFTAGCDVKVQSHVSTGAASGATSSVKIETPEKALLSASSKGDIEEVKRLLTEGVKVNVVDDDGNQPIHLAAERGHADVLTALIEHGATVESENKRRIAQGIQGRGWHFVGLSLIVDEKGTDVISGVRPIHLAVCSGNVEAVKVLLTYGAKVDAVTGIDPTIFQGLQPIHIAASKGDVEMVKFLLTSGAKALALNDETTPLGFARSNGHPELAKFLEEQSVKEAEDPIDQLVIQFSSQFHLWTNGFVPPPLGLPADAPTEQVVAKVFQSPSYIGFKDIKIIKTKKVRIDTTPCTVAYASTSGGEKLVLMMDGMGGMDWWYRVYDVKEFLAQPKASDAATPK